MTKLNASDFESLRIQIAAKNFTSGMQIASAELVDFSKEPNVEWTIVVPKNSCAQNHTLQLEFKIAEGKEQFSFSGTVKVIRIEPDPPVEYLVVTLVQFEKKDLVRFFGLFESKQESIQNLFKKLKG